MPLIRFANKNDRDISISTLLEFSRELQEKGIGPGQISSAFNGLKILWIGFDKALSWDEKNAYQNRFMRHKKAFDSRPTRKWTYPFSEKDIQYMLSKPPQNCPMKVWKQFLILGWTFLLRKSEILRIQRSELKIKRNSKGGILGVSLHVKNNKNCTNKKEYREITFKADMIPKFILGKLEEVAASKRFKWEKLPHENTILPHLKNIMCNKYDMDYYNIIIHGLRHGRADNLQKVYGVKDEQMLCYGRWSTTGGRNSYKHS